MRFVPKARSLLWGSIGAAVAYLCDPDRGRARRARLKDQLGAKVRRTTRAAERKKRYLEGKAEGAAARTTLAGTADEVVEDQVLVDKVRSEVLGGPEFSHLDVLVDVANGVVTLRGQVPGEDDIAKLEAAVAAVHGVQRVENLLHLPDTPAPNKEASREAS